MVSALLLVVCVGFASAIEQRASFLALDPDHLVDEMHNVSTPKAPEHKPKNDVEKDFASLDKNGDRKLEPEELMFRQYATGCEPIEAQVRANDYMKCGDTNKDGYISLKEFNASTQPAWAECVKESDVRRAHGFVRFFDADADLDGFLTIKELTVGTILLWGKPGEQIAGPLLGCADKNKDSKLDQKEFYDVMRAVDGPSLKQTTADAIFKAADKDKNG